MKFPLIFKDACLAWVSKVLWLALDFFITQIHSNFPGLLRRFDSLTFLGLLRRVDSLTFLGLLCDSDSL